MDIISKAIGLIMFFFPMVLLQSLESDLNEINETDQIVLNAIESVIIAENSAAIKYYDDMQYKLIMDANSKGKRYDISYSATEESSSKIAQYNYLIIDQVNEQKSQVDLHYKSCKKDQAELSWSDGAVTGISYMDSNYNLDYNEAGLVRKIVKRNPKDQKATLVYLLKYTDDDKISIVSKYKGSEIAREMLINETIYNYTDNKIEVKQISKADRKSTAANDGKIRHKTFLIDELSITEVSYKENNHAVIASVQESLYNQRGQMIKQVKSEPGNSNTIVKRYEYNNRGKLLKESLVQASKQNIISHKESLYTYNTAIDSKSNCTQHVSLLHSIYDMQGKLTDRYSESRI